MTDKASVRAKVAQAAEKYVKAGKLVAAIVEYEKLLDGGAGDLPISNIIGDLHLRHGDDDKAIRIFLANLKTLERRGGYAQALAIAKKIQKIRPHDFENLIRIGDLYGHLGFVAEARAEYLKAGEELERRRELDLLPALYEKIARIDRSDLAVRLKLARLYIQKLQTEKAVKELNEVADLLFVRGEYFEAEKVLREAMGLKADHGRTISNLVRNLSQAGKKKEAIALVERTMGERGETVELLTILANLYFGNRQDEKAAELFRRILGDDPHHADARAKLGSIDVRLGHLDEAYAVLEPLILNLLNKNKEDKAIGLLGLILMSGEMHPPSLERLATIFRIGGRRAELETADRLLLGVYRKSRRDEERARVVRELMELAPSDPEIEREFKALHWEAKVFAEAVSSPRAPDVTAVFPSIPPVEIPRAVVSEEARDIIRLNLAKADQYAAQGLVRNARRILDNLLLLYPDDPRITAKAKDFQSGEPSSERDEIAVLIEQIAAGSTRLPSLEWEGTEEGREQAKVTSAELFSGLDLGLTQAPQNVQPADSRFLDLDDKVREELEAIREAFFEQIERRAAVIEKDLAEIVRTFRGQVDAKVDRTNAEARYHLGVAFLEQGLAEEAVEEFKLAAADPEKTADCYGLIARAFVKKNDRDEAGRWLQKALAAASRGSAEFYALTYDLAAFQESLGDHAAALSLFKDVHRWNAKYRDTAKRIRILQRNRPN